MPDIDYLRGRLQRIGWTVTANGCWEWNGARKPKGYGKLGWVDGRTPMAHRVSFEVHHGPIPEGAAVCHSCDNPPCINPDHLFLGTIADNNADMRSKQREAHGERHGSHKLTASDIPRIRTLAASGVSQREIGRLFGVQQSSIADVIHRRTWRSVPELAA